jgi:uncharacterized protein YciI
MLALLFYDYVPDMLERRGPFREDHLARAAEANAAGKLRTAGAYTDPVDGALFVFNDRAAAEEFVAGDPYVTNGLVPQWRVREWNVVVGG